MSADSVFSIKYGNWQITTNAQGTSDNVFTFQPTLQDILGSAILVEMQNSFTQYRIKRIRFKWYPMLKRPTPATTTNGQLAWTPPVYPQRAVSIVWRSDINPLINNSNLWTSAAQVQGCKVHSIYKPFTVEYSPVFMLQAQAPSPTTADDTPSRGWLDTNNVNQTYYGHTVILPAYDSSTNALRMLQAWELYQEFELEFRGYRGSFP